MATATKKRKVGRPKGPVRKVACPVLHARVHPTAFKAVKDDAQARGMTLTARLELLVCEHFRIPWPIGVGTVVVPPIETKTK